MFKAHGDDGNSDGDGSEALDNDKEDEDKDENRVEQTCPSLSVSVCCRRLNDERCDGGCRFRLSSSLSLPLISLLKESLGGEAVEDV